MYQPYAAKALITHQYSAGILRIWLTFAFPMNQKHKPADTVWLVKINTVVTAVTSSAWQDAYTMLLTISGLSTYPAEVMVKYDGPDGNLETTWLKNWEPWNYILSVDITTVRTITYDPGTQEYKITHWTGAVGGQISIESQTAGTGCNINLMTKDGDGTDSIYLQLRAKGNVAGGVANSETLFMAWNTANFVIATTFSGTGTNRPLIIYTGSNTTQLTLNIDGTITTSHTLRSNVGFNVNGSAGLTATITLAKLTAGGANGSLTFTGGILTAKTDPT